MGIISSYKRYSIWDNIATLFVVTGQAMPIFWLGLMLIIIFGVNLKWLPPSGYGDVRHRPAQAHGPADDRPRLSSSRRSLSGWCAPACSTR